jgi:hypothetical protein
MSYPPEAVAATITVPKLLGAFELELRPMLEKVLDKENQIRVVLNVGCAEGYYAVGLALKLPGTTVHAFDADPSFRLMCSRMASLNGVADCISVHDAVTAAGLQAFLQTESVFVVCDCEGCELELLDPARAPGLRTATIIVELHDFVDDRISSTIIGRFRGTHDIQIIGSHGRDARRYPELDGLSHEDAALALSEARPGPMEWAWMQPLNQA